MRHRERNFSHANTARVRDDPQVLARVGEIAAATYKLDGRINGNDVDAA